MVSNDYSIRNKTSDGDRLNTVKRMLLNENNEEIYIDKKVPTFRVSNVSGNGEHSLFLINGRVTNQDGSLNEDVLIMSRSLINIHNDTTGCFITTNGKMYGFSNNDSLGDLVKDNGIVEMTSFEDLNVNNDDIVDLVTTGSGAFVICYNSVSGYDIYGVGDITSIALGMSPTNSSNTWIHGDIQNGSLALPTHYPNSGLAFKDLDQNNIVSKLFTTVDNTSIGTDITISNTKNNILFYLDGYIHYQDYVLVDDYTLDLAEKLKFYKVQIDSSLHLTDPSNRNEVTLPNYEYTNSLNNPLPDWKIVQSENAVFIFSSQSNGALYVIGSLTDDILNYSSTYSSYVQITYFRDRHLDILDVWFNGGLLMVIASDGNVYYLTNSNLYNLDLTNSASLDSGWKKVKLIKDATSFLKDGFNSNTSLPAIETILGGQFIIGSSINSNKHLQTNYFIINKTAQPINFRLNTTDSIKDVLKKIE